MPCNDISELHKIVLNDQDILIDYETIKKTCGREIGDHKYLEIYKNKEMMEILDIPFSEEMDIFERKYHISIKSTLCAYLGLEPMFNNLTTELLGVETDENAVNILTKITLSVPVENITPCAKGCGTKCGTK